MNNNSEIPNSLKKIWQTDNISLPVATKKSYRKKKIVGYSSGSKPTVSESDWARFEARIETMQDIRGDLSQSVCVLAADSNDELNHLMEIMKDVLYDLRELTSNNIHNSFIDDDEI